MSTQSREGDRFKLGKENSVEGGTSRVDYVLLVDDGESGFYVRQNRISHAQSWQFITAVRHRVIVGSCLIPRIFAEVSTRFPISYNSYFNEICIDRFVFRSETDGMAASYLMTIILFLLTRQ